MADESITLEVSRTQGNVQFVSEQLTRVLQSSHRLDSNLVESEKVAQDFKEKMEELVSKMTNINILFDGEKVGNAQVDTDSIQMKLSNILANLERILTMTSNLQKLVEINVKNYETMNNWENQ